jgi:hypothetical protein
MEKKKSKTYNHLFKRYNGAMKSGAYFDYNKLPKVNGQLIESVWCPDDFTNDPQVLDTAKWSYHTYFRNDSKEINFIGIIPEEFKKLMGWQVINKVKYFVKHISFRTSSSGHASEDSIMSIYTNKDQLSVWDRNENEKSEKGQLTQNNVYVKKWLALFGKNFKIKYPSNVNTTWEPTFPKLDKNQGTFIEKIGGLNYPTTFSPHWKPFGTNPYVSNNWPSKENLRFYDYDMNAHIFIEEVKTLEKNDSELIKCSFHNEQGQYYIFIERWNRTNEMVKYTIEKVHKKEGVTLRAYKDGLPIHKSESWGSGLYRINRISKIDEPYVHFRDK